MLFRSYLVDVDYRQRLALIGLDAEGDSIGLARYEGATDLLSAEIAIVVAPERRRIGVGGHLIVALEPPAKSIGIPRFVAGYQPDNRPIADLLSELGYGDRWLEDGLMWVAKSLL